MLKEGWMVVFLLFLPLTAASITINEVMYAPTADYGGSSNEWIELYNTELQDINLSGCALEEKPLSGMIPAKDFLIVARNQNDFTQYFGSVDNVMELSIGALNNDGEIVNLSGRAGCNEKFNYTSLAKSDFGKGNDKTLEHNFEDEWGESKVEGGTPGSENSIFNVSFHDLTLVISEVMANPFDDDDEFAPGGEWVELLNYGDREIYAGGLKITDLSEEHELYVTSLSTFGEDIFIPPQGYLVVYRNGDRDFSLNNYIDEQVRLFDGEELINFMSFSSPTEGNSMSNIEGIWYETSPTPMGDNEYTGECIWGLFIDTNNSIYRPDDFSFAIMVTRFAGLQDEITVRGQIENEHGEIIRTYAPWTNETVVSDRQQRYSPNLPAGTYQLSFWFENPPCLDVDPAAYRVTKLIGISPSYQRYDATLTIDELNMGSDKKVKWGQQFSAKLTAYRSNGTQSMIEVWVEKGSKIISPKTKVNAPTQFTQYSFTVPLQLIPNCDGKISDGAATLRVEGIGTSATQDFTIDDVDSKICTDYLDYVKDQEKAAHALSYAVDVPALVGPGEAFKITATVHNEDKSHTFKVWAYAYRGSKCYSCGAAERDSNMEEFTLVGTEEKGVDLLLKLNQEMEEGEYKVKVIFNKDNQKTNKEVVKSLYVQVPQERKETNSSLKILGDEDAEPSSISSLRSRITGAASGVIVYESNAERSKKVIPYLLLVAGVLVIVVMWRRK